MELRVGGQWLTSLRPWGDLELTYRWPGGFYEASWSISAPPTWRHPALFPGSLVEVMDGGICVGAAVMAEMDWRAGTFTATGVFRQAEGQPCLDVPGNSTSILDYAIDRAVTYQGLPWRRRESISGVAFGDSTSTDSLNYLDQLLDAYTTSIGAYWYVDADRFIHVGTNPTVPKWHLAPGSVSLGNTDDDYASDVFLRYQKPDLSYATIQAAPSTGQRPFGFRAYIEDVTSYGALAPSVASGIATSIRDQVTARIGWTEPIEAARHQLMTSGGEPAALSMVMAGDLVRLHGTFDDVRNLTGRDFVDVVVSESKWAVGGSTVTLSPQGLAPQNLADVTEAQFVAATGRGFRS